MGSNINNHEVELPSCEAVQLAQSMPFLREESSHLELGKILLLEVLQDHGPTCTASQTAFQISCADCWK